MPSTASLPPPVETSAGRAPAPHARAVWTNRDRSAWTSVDEVEGLCLVCLAGTLDEAAVQPCRAALDAALARQSRGVIIDLGSSGAPQPATVALLGAVRRYLRRRGVPVTLARVPDQLMQALTRAGVRGLYTFREGPEGPGQSGQQDQQGQPGPVRETAVV